MVMLPLVSTHQARTPSMQLPGTKRAVFPARPPGLRRQRCSRASHGPGRTAPADNRLPGQRPHQRRGPGAGGALRDPRPPVRQGNSGNRPRKPQKADPRTASGPGSPAATAAGATAHHFPARYRHVAPQELTLFLSVPRSADHLLAKMVVAPCGPDARHRQEQDVTRREQ